MSESRNDIEPVSGVSWSVVLIEPARGGNIGAAARAMKTMGFDDLRVVDPAGDTPVDSDEARAFAHGSTEILDRLTRFATLPDAIDDCDLVIGTTGRRRGQRSEFLTPDEVIDVVRHGPEVERIALVFGPEERGLSNDELDYCDLVSAVPMHAPYPSLNLGQAVMVYTYALSPLVFYSARPLRGSSGAATIHALHKKASALLPEIGFDPGRAIMKRMLERMATANADDARLLHSLLNAIEIHLTGNHRQSDR